MNRLAVGIGLGLLVIGATIALYIGMTVVSPPHFILGYELVGLGVALIGAAMFVVSGLVAIFLGNRRSYE